MNLRPVVRWTFPASLFACLTMVPLHARAQQDTSQNLQPIENIAPVPGLKAQIPIAMPTARSQGREPVTPGGASPFSGAMQHGRGSAASQAVRFPADLEDQGGPTVRSAEHHAIFVDPTAQCAPNSCWGDPIGFLRDLSESQFIGVTDQYVNASAPDRYPDGANYYLPAYAPSAGSGNPFTDADMALAAYAVAASTGSFGLGHIYHLFLVPGQDVCFDSTFSVCYSPDNVNTWAFCAYHGSAMDAAGNVVLYTVEPYQNVPGCNVRPGTPNGQLVDSTNNVLSHETFETITDPEGSAWWNSLDNGLYGQEIGDECAFLTFTATSAYFDPSIVRLNRKLYAAQPEYSNALHACTTIPVN
jgi:hypothetical protein